MTNLNQPFKGVVLNENNEIFYISLLITNVAKTNHQG